MIPQLQGTLGRLIRRTMDMIVTHGRFKLAMMAMANDVFPDPELPATPMMLALPHGGE